MSFYIVSLWCRHQTRREPAQNEANYLFDSPMFGMKRLFYLRRSAQ